jgi:signal peptidase II
MLFSDQPYGTYFHGKVVDMFYFPFWHGNLPSWLPFGVVKILLFNAIFNVADMAISTGVGILIFSIKKRFIRVRKSDKKKTNSNTELVFYYFITGA